MKKGDDAFNSRDVAGMNATHHPDIIAHVMGIAKPIKGRKAHAAMIQQMISVFPDIHVHNDPYPTQFGSGDWITVITRATGTFTGEDDSARRQGDRPDRKSVRPRLQHDRPVGRRRAH
jgi:ketosteroid isomerase-like protein